MLNKVRKNFSKFVLLFLLLIAPIFVFFIYQIYLNFDSFSNNFFSEARAANPNNALSGWAWASNIGWISFNCNDIGACGWSDYKVLYDFATGKLSGWAWSSNVGWIRFGYDGYCITDSTKTATIDSSTGAVSGWFKLCNQDSLSGWSKFYSGAQVQNGILTGWSWDSDILGWTSFYNTAPYPSVTVPSLNCTFSANPNSIQLPDSSTLSWGCYFSSSCSVSDNSGNTIVSSYNASNDTNYYHSSSEIVRPSQNTTYTLTCNGLFGPKSYTADVVVAGRDSGDNNGSGGNGSGGSGGSGGGSGSGTNINEWKEIIPE